MTNLNPILRIALGAICVVLGLSILGEWALSVPDVAALPNDPPSASVTFAPMPSIDADDLTKTILDHPLFTASRMPPAAPQMPQAAAKTAPQLHARLAGMIVGPDDREALFARDAGPVVAVHEQQEIDGWKVASIDAEKVVLQSDFGERVLHPTEGLHVAPRNTGPVRVRAPGPPPPPVAVKPPGVNVKGGGRT